MAQLDCEPDRARLRTRYLTVSDTFTAATAYAVERWQQAALGLPVTGAVPPGQVAYAPGPLRVTRVDATLGRRRSPARRC